MWTLNRRLDFSKNLVAIERNGYSFYVSKSPLSSFRYKSPEHQYVTVGHKYFLGEHLVVGHAGIDALEAITVGEKVVWGPDWNELRADSLEDNTGVWAGHFTEYVAWLRANYATDVLKDSNIGPAAATQASSEDAADNTYWLAQTFTTTSSYTITAVGLSIWRNSGYPGVLGDITISIKATDGDGHPTGDDLCFATLDASEFPDLFSYTDWTTVQFDNPCILDINTKYAIVVRLEQRITGRFFNWQRDTTDKYAGGILEESSDIGVTWVAYARNPTYGDCLFKTYTQGGFAPNSQISIYAANIFGGDEKEGGISGKVDLLFGASDQAQNGYLTSKIDSDIPAYRGLTSMVLRQVYMGTSPYLKPWSFLCKRTNKLISGDAQWYPEKAVINPREAYGDDLNPAHIIRECLTDKEFGSGWDADDDIDDASFKVAADTLYEEDFGLSLLWDQIQPMDEFIGNILACIAGFLYQDLESGKWVLSLTRESKIGRAIVSNTEAVAGGTIYERYITSRAAGFQLEQYQAGQTFVAPSSFDTDRIQLLLHTSHSMTVRLELQGTKDDDDYDTIYKIPDGNVLAYSEVTEADIPATSGWVTFSLNKKVSLVKGQTYAFIFYTTASEVAAYLYYDYDQWNYATAMGNVLNGSYVSSTTYGGTWGAHGQVDFLGFKILGADVETYDEADIIDIEDFVRPACGEVTNLVTVNWWDKIENKTRPADSDDIALIKKQQGRIVPLVLNMYGLGNATIASKVADRELKLASTMLASLRLRCTRTMSHLKPNELFRISWDKYNITNMLLRVLEINYGSLTNNEIAISCLEVLETEAYETVNIAPDDILPAIVNDPAVVDDAHLVEIPYWIICKEIESQQIIDGYATTTGYVMLIAAPPTDDAYGFVTYLRVAAGLDYNLIGNGSWCPSATLESEIYMESDDITIDIADITDVQTIGSRRDEDPTVIGPTGYPIEGTYALIGNEIVKVLNIDGSLDQLTIARGVLDTVPEEHAVGTKIYLIGTSVEIMPAIFTDGDEPAVKLLTKTSSGTLPFDAAPAVSAAALDSRMIRPYAPGNLKFNTERFPTFLSSKAASKFTLTWNHRDRTDATQLNNIVEHTTATDYGPEAGATYTIKVYDEDNVLQRTVTGLSAKTYDYTHAFEISDCGSLQSQLRFVIYSVRDGFDSFQSYDVLIKRSFVATSAPAATLSGSLHVETPMRGSCTATSSLDSAELKLPDLFGTCSATTTITGHIIMPGAWNAASIAITSVTGSMAELASEGSGMAGAAESVTSTCGDLIVANDFTKDSSVVALWRFEGANLLVDSIGNNDLTTGGVTADSDASEGSTSALFERANGDYMVIADADLDSGVPLKSGETNRKLTWCFRLKFASQDIAQYLIYKGGSPNHSIKLQTAGNLIELVVSTNGTSWTDTGKFTIGFVKDKDYFIAITYDGDDGGAYRIRIWDVAANAVLAADKTGSLGVAFIGASDFNLGYNSSSWTVDGRMDEFVWFDRVLSLEEISEVRRKVFAVET